MFPQPNKWWLIWPFLWESVLKFPDWWWIYRY